MAWTDLKIWIRVCHGSPGRGERWPLKEEAVPSRDALIDQIRRSL